MVSVYRRSILSIFTNALKALLSFITGVILARGLGVEEYGVFAFLMSSFTASRLLLDMGTSSAFFTFISKFNRSKHFFRYYGAWLLFQFVISTFFILLVAPDSWVNSIWQGENKIRVILAFMAVFLQQTIWIAITHIGESQRLTLKVQKINISIAAFHLVAVVTMFMMDTLSIERVFIFVAIEFLLATIYSYYCFTISYGGNNESLKDIFKEYKVYCSPLIPFVWVSMLSVFTNTWLLQKYSGSIEQAYYAIAVQFSSVSFILITPVLNILWKEVSESYEQGNISQLHSIYSRTCRFLFLLPAIMVGMAVPWATEIINIVLGNEYSSAAPVMQLMFIYSIWQSLGAININTFYALELTTARAVIGITFALISLPFTYLMIAPADAVFPGSGLGAVGLALKMLCLQFISVNVYSWWVSRSMKWEFNWFYQIVVMFTCLGIGFSVYFSMNSLMFESLHLILRMMIAASLYVLLIAIIAYRKPFLLGMTKNDISKGRDMIIGFFFSIKKRL